MKRTLVLIVCLCLVSGTAFAEGNSVHDFFHETFSDVKAIFARHMDDRKTLNEIFQDFSNALFEKKS